MADTPNTLRVTREIDGFTFTGLGRYVESADGWDCRVCAGHGGPPIEVRGPVGNPWSEIEDMIEIALDLARRNRREGWE